MGRAIYLFGVATSICTRGRLLKLRSLLSRREADRKEDGGIGRGTSVKFTASAAASVDAHRHRHASQQFTFFDLLAGVDVLSMD